MDEKYEQTAQGRIMMTGVFVVFALALLVSFYTVYEKQPAGETRPQPQESALGDLRGQTVSIEDVTKDPNTFVGKTISVRGQVEKNVGTRGMTVGTTEAEPEELLVVSRESLVGVGGGPGEAQYKANEGVRISGELRTFNLKELENEIGAPLNEEAYLMYEGKPVIIAESIVPLQDF